LGEKKAREEGAQGALKAIVLSINNRSSFAGAPVLVVRKVVEIVQDVLKGGGK
jgi:hypothetical protein